MDCDSRRHQGKEAISRWRTLKGQIRGVASQPPHAGTTEAAVRQQAERHRRNISLQPIAEDLSEGHNGFADDQRTAVVLAGSEVSHSSKPPVRVYLRQPLDASYAECYGAIAVIMPCYSTVHACA